MEPTIFQISIKLLEMISLIIVFAYLFSRSRFFIEVLENRPLLSTRILLIIIFGLLSIYGLNSGITISGAVLNVRDLGPILAGLICGPYIGFGAGLIGSVYRMTLGGTNVIGAAIGPVLAGSLSGIAWLVNKRALVSTRAAVIITVIIESFITAIALIIRIFSGSSSQASQVITILLNIALPMIIFTAIGVGIFTFIIHNLLTERKTQSEKEELKLEMTRKDAELEIAAEIQKGFFPEVIPQIEGFQITGRSIPAKEVGGDFFDVMPFEVIPFGSSKISIMIADASGKGVPAALFMALSRIVVRISAQWYKDPHKAIAFANRVVSKDSKTGMFVTLFYGVLNNVSKSMVYVNAGHNPPIIYHKDSASIVELELTGVALGAIDDIDFEQREVNLSSGDILVLYTDGITEAINSADEMFGTTRLISLIKEGTETISVSDLADKIINAVNVFSGKMPQFDDITLLIVKVL